jgi:hypothetical protein
MKKAVIAAVVAVLVLAGAGAAWALTGDDESTATGRCDQVAYELTAEQADDGQQVLEVSFELQSAGPGETWQVQLQQDGTPVYDGSRTTDEDGEVDMDVTVDEKDGDTFEVTATPTQGEPCTASLQR